MVFQQFKLLVDHCWTPQPPPSGYATGSLQVRLIQLMCSECCEIVFSRQVINTWNNLPSRIVEVETAHEFQWTICWLSDCIEHLGSPRIYQDMHHLGLCTLPMLRCWSFLAYKPNWPIALFLLLLHPPGNLYVLAFDCAKHSDFQMLLENPSIQTHLVLLCRIKRLFFQVTTQLQYNEDSEPVVDRSRNWRWAVQWATKTN